MFEEPEYIKLSKLYLIKTILQDMVQILNKDTTLKDALDHFPGFVILPVLIEYYGEDITIENVLDLPDFKCLEDPLNMKKVKQLIKIDKTERGHSMINLMQTLINIGYNDLTLDALAKQFTKVTEGLKVGNVNNDMVTPLIEKYGPSATISSVYYSELEGC